MLSFKETDKPVQKLYKNQQLFPLSNRISYSNKKNGLIPEKKSPKQRGIKFLVYTQQWLTCWLPDTKCLFQLPNAVIAGATSGEFCREDLQHMWSHQLLGPYPIISKLGIAGHEQQGSSINSPKFIISKLILLSTWQLLGQGVAILFGKPADWEYGEWVSQSTILSKLEFGLFMF